MPRSYKTFFMLISAEFELSTGHNNENTDKNKEVYCFKSLRCCIYHANKC